VTNPYQSADFEGRAEPVSWDGQTKAFRAPSDVLDDRDPEDLAVLIDDWTAAVAGADRRREL
jgi:hypothetical protein